MNSIIGARAVCALAVLLLSLAPLRAFSAPAADGAVLNRVKGAMQGLGGGFKDMEAIAEIIVSPPRGSGDQRRGRQVSMTAHLYLKMPDKVKFQVLNSTFPLFNRWIFLQRGAEFAAYDPVSDRYVTTDFRRLTGREPARMDTKFAMLGLLFDPKRYRFEMLGKSVRNGVGVYKIRMRLFKPEVLNPLTNLAYTDMYVDTTRLCPVHSESFDTANRLATTGEFRDPVRTPAGWAPTHITITDHEIDRVRSHHKVQHIIEKATGARAPEAKPRPASFPTDRRGALDVWIGWKGNVLYPAKMSAQAPDGGSTQWTYTNTKVNSGMPDSVFRLNGR